MKQATLFLWVFIFCNGFSLTANNNFLIGLTENHLVEINLAIAETNIITNVDFPSNISTIKNLVYIPDDCLFYSIGNFGQNPFLLSITWEGTVNVIGQMTLNNEVLSVAEGLAYNNIDEQLYISTNIQTVFSSTIATIDKTTAICEAITTINTADDDADSMIFIDNQLFIFDGVPNSNSSNFYLLDFTNVPLNSNPTFLANTTHYSCIDFAIFNNHLYFPLPSFELYEYDLSASQFNFDLIGYTNSEGNLGNNNIRGIEYIENYERYYFNIDTSMCVNTSIQIGLDTPLGATVEWNTGVQTPTITIEEAGMYWANILLDNCIPIKTDTITVVTEICDCSDVFNQIEAQLHLPNDTVLCDNNLDFILEILVSEEFEVVWNDGTLGNNIIITETGNYSATLSFQNCFFNTDTIAITFEECDADCSNVFNQIEAQLHLPNDTVLCNNNLDFILEMQVSEEFEVVWNDGTLGNNIIITETGNYSATLSFQNCFFNTDTIAVTFEECGTNTSCSYAVPNAFSPNNDNINDYFSVKFDNTCEIEHFEMQIYNRWGNLIAHTTDNLWNGTKKGNALEIGVYVYLISFDTWENGALNNIQTKGNITLIR